MKMELFKKLRKKYSEYLKDKKIKKAIKLMVGEHPILKKSLIKSVKLNNYLLEGEKSKKENNELNDVVNKVSKFFLDYINEIEKNKNLELKKIIKNNTLEIKRLNDIINKTKRSLAE